MGREAKQDRACAGGKRDGIAGRRRITSRPLGVDLADQSSGLQLGYEATQVLLKLAGGHLVLTGHHVADLHQGLAFFQELPNARADSVEPEIDSACKVEDDELVAHLAAHHLFWN